MFRSKQEHWRRAVQILLTLLALYVLLALLVMIFQRKLIYYPTRVSSEVATRLAEQEGLQAWRNKAGELIGWHLPATGAVLIIHGNAGCGFNRSYLAEPIHAAAAVDVFVLEYPGYGCRSGAPSQHTILKAAEEAFETLADRSPFYIVSESLGAGAAAHLAQKHGSKAAGLALFAPFDKLSSVGQAQMPFLPVGLLLWDRFNPAESLQHYSGPVKVVLAEADTIIPAKFGQRLHDSYRGPKSIEIIPGAGHNDIAEQTPEWWKEVFAFWEKNQPRN
jgi:pimeloyl-ACP methyl ester carboxylesterase